MSKSNVWRRWLNLLPAPARSAAPRGGRTSPLWLELLEDRLAPAAPTVQFGLASEHLLESAGTFTIPITLSNALGTDTTIAFTTGGTATSPTDYTLTTTSPVVIPAGQLATDITGSLATPGDGVQTLTLTIPSAPAGTSLGAQTTNTITINQLPPIPTNVSIGNATMGEPASGSGSVNMDFTVTRTGDLTSRLNVAYTTVPGTAQPSTDFTPITGTASFDSGLSTATIAIPIFGNGVYNKPDLTFSVQLTGVVSEFGPPVTTSAQTTSTTGPSPDRVAVGDFNGDGKPDIVTTDYSLGMISVLLDQTAAGPPTTPPTFSPGLVIPTGKTGADEVAVGDINGDGKPDIVVTNSGSGDVSVFINTTTTGAVTPSFAAAQSFNTGTTPQGVALADINGDGKLDIITANTGSNNVSVLLNQTVTNSMTAAFAPAQNFTVLTGPDGVAVGDFNGDGKPDIVAADSGSDPAAVSVLVNTTAAGSNSVSFAGLQNFTTGTGPGAVAVGDFNGDGKLDIVTANVGSTNVSVLLNSTTVGSNTVNFVGHVDSPAGTSSGTSVALRDLNGDYLADIITTVSGSSAVEVMPSVTAPGAATATIGTAVPLTVGTAPTGVAVADFNGDSQLDIVAANSSAINVSVLLNETTLGAAALSPDFPQPAAPVLTQSNLVSVAVGDLNGDGKEDLIIATGAVGPNNLTVLLHTPAAGATFGAAHTYTVAGTPVGVAVADVNGDGKPDLIVVTSAATNNVEVLLNTTATAGGATAFGAAQSFTITGTPVGVAVGDINGDGLPDVVVATSTADTNNVAILLNTTAGGAFNLAAAQYTSVAGTPVGVAVADLNDDSKPDVAVATSAGNVVVLPNTTAPVATTPTFAAAQTIAVGATDPLAAVAIGDINGDGKPDLIVAYGGYTSVMLNNTAPGAALSFASPVDFAYTATYPVGVAVGDLNGDGRPDLANVNGASATVLLNTPVEIPGDTATGTIQENDTEPQVEFSVASETINAATGTFSITVDMSPASGVEVMVPFTIDAASTAVNGVDYTLTTTSPLDFPATQASATITGTLIAEGSSNQTLIFDLGTPTPAGDAMLRTGGILANTLTITEPPPTPTLDSINPTFVLVGSPATTITLNSTAGTFVAASVADFNGVPLTTHFVSANQLTAVIPASDLTTAGTAAITVVTPAPGGGTSGSQTFSIDNPVPTLTSINPNQAAVGSPDLTITLTGTNFLSTSTADFNGTTLSTTFVSATQLTAVIPSSTDFVVGNVGPNSITVVNPTPGGGPSNGVTFTVTANNPTPTLTGISPTSGAAGDPDTTITLTGTNFVGDSSAEFNGTAIATTYVSASQLTAVIPAADLTTAGNFPVTVVNPQGGGASGAQNFAVNNPAPTLTAIDPTRATVGSPDTTITLTGTNFVTNASVLFGSTPIVTTYVSTTTLTAVIPAADLAALGTDPISVFNPLPGGGVSNTEIFTIDAGPPPSAQFDVASEVLSEASGTFTLTVSLSSAYAQNATIPFVLGGTAVNGVDYTIATANPLVIPAGQTSATITGTLIDDHLFDTNNLTLTITLTMPTNATIGTNATNTLTIVPDASIAEPVATIGTPSQSGATFFIPVTLSAPSEVTTTLSFTLGGTAGVGGVTPANGLLVIPAGQTSGVITGVFTDGGFGGSSQTVVVTLTGAVNAVIGPPNPVTFSEVTLGINGVVYSDFNANGVLDGGETGVAGQTVYLDLNRDGHLDAVDPFAVTDANGAYSIAAPLGSYLVRVVAFPGDTLTSGANGLAVTLATGPATGVNFGEVVAATFAPVQINADLFGASNPDPNTAFVVGMYQAVLGRTPGDLEVQYWDSVMQKGVTQQQAAQSIVASVEHRVQEVEDYYETYLHRTADAAGRAHWVDLFLQGADETTVVAGILNTAEFFQLNGSDDGAVASDLYFSLLGRQASSTEQAWAKGQLDAGMSVGDLAQLFLHSQEADQLAVNGFYAAYLHRAADAGSATWVNLLLNGATYGDVEADILGGAEFYGDGAATVGS